MDIQEKTQNKIRVVLADDHPFVRIGIRNIIQKAGDIVVVGEAGDGRQAVDMVQELEPDLLVLDMEMPIMNGIEVAQCLQRIGYKLPILALSAHEDRQFILGMLATSAAGYLTKEEVPDNVLKAIRGVARGERGWVSQRVAARIGVWLRTEDPDNIALTEDDIALLRLMLYGKRHEEIGETLGMSKRSVAEGIDRAINTVRQHLIDTKYPA